MKRAIIKIFYMFTAGLLDWSFIQIYYISPQNHPVKRPWVPFCTLFLTFWLAHDLILDSRAGISFIKSVRVQIMQIDWLIALTLSHKLIHFLLSLTNEDSCLWFLMSVELSRGTTENWILEYKSRFFSLMRSFCHSVKSQRIMSVLCI